VAMHKIEMKGGRTRLHKYKTEKDRLLIQLSEWWHGWLDGWLDGYAQNGK